MATESHPGIVAGRHVNELAAGVFGAVFIIVGLLGFTVSGGHDVAGHTGGDLLGVFQVNVLHNLVHMAVGVIMVVAAFAGLRAAKVTNVLIGAVYLALGVVGLFIT